MPLQRLTSPHAHNINSTSLLMQKVMLATVPGIAALTVFFGWGSILNIVLAIICALFFEALCLTLRGRAIRPNLADCSALVTAVLLGIALPPYCPWWLVVCGVFFAIVIAKQLYGGLGYNPFNPAMVGYVVLLISFPVDMTRWAAPELLSDSQSLLSLAQALQAQWTGLSIDGYTAATPLDAFKFKQGQTVNQLYADNTLFSQAAFAGLGWEWVNVGFLLGGLYLLQQRIFSWHAPVAMLAVLAILPLFAYDGSSDSAASPLLHLFSGATMLGAFFIVTDPVSSTVSNKGRLYYGALIGLLIWVIREWGSYPDAVAFAVLLANFCAPFIDHYTLPRSYGHAQAKHATQEVE